MAKARTRKSSTTNVKPSAAPGTKDDAAEETEEEKKGRTVYTDGLSEKQLADPEVYPFSATPEDFDFQAHRELKKKDFQAEHQWYTHKSDACVAKAERYQELGEASKQKGGKKEKAAAKRLVKMQKTMATLQKTLKAAGMNVEELMAKALAEAEAEAAKE